MTVNSKRFVFLFLLSFCIGLLAFQLTSPNRTHFFKDRSSVKFFGVTPTPENTTRIPPTRISFSTLGKTLPISAALVKDNQWDLFDDKVSWLSTSAVPSEGGNIILYAHNTQKMFGDLYLLKTGDLVQLMQDNVWIPYKVVESRNIQSNDIESVLSSQDLLTLYTCEGNFNQKRRVIFAKPL